MTTFIVPDNAVINDQEIKTEASMIIGNHAVINRGVRSGFLMVGEGVHITGEINTDDDLRADVWCKFDQNVNVEGDAYIGEFTAINGKIVVEGDLDIGKEVKLNGGFLSKGWVVVRNPLPVMVFIFLYIRALIGVGKSSEEIDKALAELFEDEDEIDLENMDENKLSELVNRGGFFVIPLGSKISSESINVPEDMIIGNDCTLNTRMICKHFEGGKNLVMNGYLRSKGETRIAEGSRISGEINTSGKLIIDKNVKIDGKISAKSVLIHESSFVEGKVSSGNIRFVTGDDFDIKDPENAEKATILSKSDSFDLITSNITEKKEEEEEIIDAETDEYLEADSEDRNAEAEAAEAEMEQELTEAATDEAEVETAEVSIDEAANETAEESTEETASETTEESTDETANETTEESTDETANETTEESTDETANETTEESTDETANETTEESASETSAKTAESDEDEKEAADESDSGETAATESDKSPAKAEKKQGSTSKRAQKRRAKKANAEQKEITIVNVFTGEDFEKEQPDAEDEQTDSAEDNETDTLSDVESEKTNEN
ncbi:hypothetical protein LJC08_04170 [Methanimicrococcus sp. OttesenSCG-928-J09]|nr:hypothetical protein [Methanimicrococcus sp. OttesenSCG-928-J09]